MFINNNKIYTRTISMVMALLLAIILILPITDYAKAATSYTQPYGVPNPDEDYYIWHQVKDDLNPMYTYLLDGDSKEYESGKTFRVLLIHKFNRTVQSSSSISGYNKTTYLGLATTTKHEYNETVYYNADWTKIKIHNTYNTGNSIVKIRDDAKELNHLDFKTVGTNMTDVLADTFVTRGAMRSFICDYSNVWQENGKDHTPGLAGNYVGKHKYHFYYSDEADRNPLYTLTATFGGFWGSHDFYAYDKDGKSWAEGKQTGTGREKMDVQIDKNTRGYAIDTWGIISKGTSSAGEAQMKMVAYDQKGTDYAFCVDDEANANVEEYDDGRENWIMYVGEPCPSYMLSSMNGENEKDGKLANGNVRTISKPQVLKKDETYTVEEGAVLFVDDLLILRGTINNKGLIVVESPGAIFSWNQDKGKIVNEGGDIIVRNKAIVYVGEYTATGQTAEIYNSVYSKKFTIKDSVINIKSANQDLVSVGGIAKYDSIRVTSAEGEEKITFDYNQFQTNGSGDSKSIDSDVKIKKY